MVFLIAGNVGSGKSTYSLKLSQEYKAHIFQIDDWMEQLFAPDRESIDVEVDNYEWNLERVQRIEHQILEETKKLDMIGVNTILDLGFFGIEQRQRVREFLISNEIEWYQHFLNVDKKTRWARVQKRNQEKGETFQFSISQEVFEFCETIFEPLQSEELEMAEVLEIKN